MKGYMTVEASFVLPMVFGVVMFVLSLLFYSYDRCLLEQDVMSLIVRSEYIEGDGLEEKVRSMEAEVGKWYREKYVWADIAVQKLTVKEDSIRISAEGSFRGPFFEQMAVDRGMKRLPPTFILRQKIKLEKELENMEGTDEYGIYQDSEL